MPKVQFYTDENIPAAVIDHLRRRGVTVITYRDAGMIGATDPAHLAYASEQGCVLLTRDDDFLRLHEDWLLARLSHSGIVFVPSARRMSVEDVARSLLILHDKVDSGEMADRVHCLANIR